MNKEIVSDLCSRSINLAATRGKRFIRIAQTIVAIAGSLAMTGRIASAQRNPGDPLFCQPAEGTTFLIVNGGSGVFTVDGDCYGSTLGSNPANTPPSTIATTQGGTLTLVVTVPPFSGGQANYIYTPPTPGFTGLDTFQIMVSTVWNAAGGPGSAGGSSRPGGPATYNPVTLNVIPATTTLSVSGPALVPVPAGSVTGCGAQGSAGLGPPPSAVPGCITRVTQGFGGVVQPSHGTISTSGNTIRYTPTPGYTGPDTFTYQAQGINTDGSNALDSGNVTVQVTVNPAIVISPSSVNISPNAPYSQTLTASGGFPGYTFSIASGTLPPGLTLSSSGLLSGTPSGNGTFNVTIQVTDSASNTVLVPFSITINSPAPTAVPTLGGWGMLLLGGSLLLYGFKAAARAGV